MRPRERADPVLSDPLDKIIGMTEVLEDPREAAGLATLDELASEEAVLYARRARQLVDSARLSEQLERADRAPRFLVLDLAGTLRTGQRAAQNQLGEALRLVEDFPLMWVQLRAGAVLVVQARRVIEHTIGLSSAVAREVDRRLAATLWADPASWAGARLTRAVTRLVLQAEADLEPAAAAERLERARAGRKVVARSEADGMGSLWALLPAEKLVAFARGLDALTARQAIADRAAGVERTADQRRADVFADLPSLALHALSAMDPAQGPVGACRHPRMVFDVQVPMATLLGHSNAPGHLDGYGPISAHQVRLLLPDAHLRQVLVDAVTGQVVATSRDLIPPAREASSSGRDRAGRSGAGPHTGRPGRSTARGQRPMPTCGSGTSAEEAFPPPGTGGSSAGSSSPTSAPAASAPGASSAAASGPAASAPGASSAATPAPAASSSSAAVPPPAMIHWLGGPEDHPDRLVAHLAAPATQSPPRDGETADGAPASDAGPVLDVGAGPSAYDRERLARLVPSDVLVVGDAPEDGYRPSAALTRLLRSRDALCTGPGCAEGSRRSDLDHADPWPHGPTNAENMRPHSRRCHRAKTRSWRAVRTLDGTLHWTSPTCRTYRVPTLWVPAPTLLPRQVHPSAEPGLTQGGLEVGQEGLEAGQEGLEAGQGRSEGDLDLVALFEQTVPAPAPQTPPVAPLPPPF